MSTSYPVRARVARERFSRAASDYYTMLHDLFSFCALLTAGAAGALISSRATLALARVVERRPRR